MSWDIASILVIDGLANSAVYLLAGLGLVMIFCVTRVVFIPFGDVAAFAALTMAALEAGQMPPTVWLVAVLTVVAVVVEGTHLVKKQKTSRIPRVLGLWIVLPAIPCAAAWFLAGQALPTAVAALLSIALVMPIAPLVARVALQPIADASVLALFMVALALHFLLSGLGLLFFGPEGSRTEPLIAGSVDINGFVISAQTLLMMGTSIVLCALFYLLFERTLTGKALRATAINRTGARLVAIRPGTASLVAYSAASLLAGVIGVLIAPVITVYFDSGLILGLKAFVAATIGGLVSYPLTAVGAVAVGLMESFSSFWAGSMKDVIVFSLLIPVLIVRSAFSKTTSEETEELD